MNLLTVYKAAEALESLNKNNGLTAREAYGLMKLRNALREDALFFASKRNELLSRYGTPDEKTPGKYGFTDKDKFDAFEQAVKELADTEAHVRYDPVILRGELVGITPAMLSDLDGFVTVS